MQHINTFKKEERLCSKKTLEAIIASPRVSHTSLFRALWILVPPHELDLIPCQIAISVPKRSFKHAVDRNLLKRRTRESYRLNKHHFLHFLKENGCSVRLLLVYKSRDIHTQEDVSHNIISLLKKLEHEITKHLASGHAGSVATEGNPAPGN